MLKEKTINILFVMEIFAVHVRSNKSMVKKWKMLKK